MTVRPPPPDGINDGLTTIATEVTEDQSATGGAGRRSSGGLPPPPPRRAPPPHPFGRSISGLTVRTASGHLQPNAGGRWGPRSRSGRSSSGGDASPGAFRGHRSYPGDIDQTTVDAGGGEDEEAEDAAEGGAAAGSSSGPSATAADAAPVRSSDGSSTIRRTVEENEARWRSVVSGVVGGGDGEGRSVSGGDGDGDGASRGAFPGRGSYLADIDETTIDAGARGEDDEEEEAEEDGGDPPAAGPSSRPSATTAADAASVHSDGSSSLRRTAEENEARWRGSGDDDGGSFRTSASPAPTYIGRRPPPPSSDGRRDDKTTASSAKRSISWKDKYDPSSNDAIHSLPSDVRAHRHSKETRPSWDAMGKPGTKRTVVPADALDFSSSSSGRGAVRDAHDMTTEPAGNEGEESMPSRRVSGPGARRDERSWTSAGSSPATYTWRREQSDKDGTGKYAWGREQRSYDRNAKNGLSKESSAVRPSTDAVRNGRRSAVDDPKENDEKSKRRRKLARFFLRAVCITGLAVICWYFAIASLVGRESDRWNDEPKTVKMEEATGPHDQKLDDKETISVRPREPPDFQSSIALPPDLDFAFTGMSLPHVPGRDLPVLWNPTLSGGAAVEAVLGNCLNLVQGSNRGIYTEQTTKLRGQEEGGKETTKGEGLVYVGGKKKLEVVHIYGQSYANVDTKSESGIERAAELKLTSSGMVDVIYTPLLHSIVRLFPEHADPPTTTYGRLFAIFRHPVERAVNMFHATQASTFDHKRPGNMPHNMAEYATSDRAENNPITRTLVDRPDGPLTARSIELAQEIVRKKMLVGLYSDLPESMRRFEEYMGWHVSSTKSMIECHDLIIEKARAKYDYPPLDPESEVYKLFVAQNDYDLIVYDYVVANFELQGKRFFGGGVTGVAGEGDGGN